VAIERGGSGGAIPGDGGVVGGGRRRRRVVEVGGKVREEEEDGWGSFAKRTLRKRLFANEPGPITVAESGLLHKGPPESAVLHRGR
jgi:hypothetical protein